MAFGRIKNLILRIYDSLTAKKTTVSIGDIVNMRTSIENNQFLLTTRLLDIEDYQIRGITSFNWQNAISRKAYGSNHREEGGNKAFIKLIHSYLENGYDTSSYFVVDQELRLLDGNHRMGMNLFMGIDTINVRILKRKSHNLKTIDWYLKVGLDTSFIKKVIDRYQNIQNEMVDTGNVFCAIVPDSVIAEDLSFLVRVKKIDLFSDVPQSITWNGVSLPARGVLIRFTLNDPRYYVKSGHAYSKRIEEIKNIINLRTDDTIFITRNCLEGRQLFEIVKQYLDKD